jgi:hypothetical protein
MELTLNDYRCWLVNEILMASSLEEVKNQIESAIKNMKQNDIPEAGISGFAEKTIGHLERLEQVDYGMQQWTNIYYSKMELQSLANSMKMAKAIH